MHVFRLASGVSLPSRISRIPFHWECREEEKKIVHTYCVLFVSIYSIFMRRTIERCQCLHVCMCRRYRIYIYIFINTRQPGSLSRDKIKRRNFSTVFLLGVRIFSSSLFFVVFAVVSWTWKCVCVCVCLGTAIPSRDFLLENLYHTFGAYTLHT